MVYQSELNSSREPADETSEITRILVDLGWSAYTDEVGDKYAHFKLSDRIVK